MSRPSTPLPQRFWSKLRYDTTTGCWLWTGATHNFGYGVIGRGSRDEGLARAHRLAWELTFGLIPAGLFVCHACDVPACCNPGHLFLGTQTENMRDMSAKGRASRPAAKLTPDDVRELRAAKLTGATNKELARRFNINPRQVRKIASQEQWVHVD